MSPLRCSRAGLRTLSPASQAIPGGLPSPPLPPPPPAATRCMDSSSETHQGRWISYTSGWPCSCCRSAFASRDRDDWLCNSCGPYVDDSAALWAAYRQGPLPSHPELLAARVRRQQDDAADQHELRCTQQRGRHPRDELTGSATINLLDSAAPAASPATPAGLGVANGSCGSACNILFEANSFSFHPARARDRKHASGPIQAPVG
jgi:hypothetical protein